MSSAHDRLGIARVASLGFDLRRLGLDQPDDMIDHVLVLDRVVAWIGRVVSRGTAA